MPGSETEPFLLPGHSYFYIPKKGDRVKPFGVSVNFCNINVMHIYYCKSELVNEKEKQYLIDSQGRSSYTSMCKYYEGVARDS
jgi:hypothetical protein